MNKLFLFAALVSLLFAMPLAFAAVSDSGAGASIGASSKGDSAATASSPVASSSGASTVSSSSDSKSGGAVSSTGAATISGTGVSQVKGDIAPTPAVKPAPTSLPSARDISASLLPIAKPKLSDNASPPANTYSVLVLPTFANLIVGQSQQFIALLMVNGAAPTDVPFVWSTTGGVGIVTQDGLFTATALGGGSVFATYFFPNFSVSGAAHVQVSNFTSPPVNNSTSYSLFIVPPNATLDINDTQQFTVYASLPNGSIMQVPNSDLAWSTAGGIGNVGSTGLFTATTAGIGTVSAIFTGPIPISVTQSIVTAFVTVNSGPPPPPPPNGSYYIMISPASATLLVGATQQFVAQLYDSNGTYLLDVPNADLSWLSSNTAVGTIDALGVFSAIAQGFSVVKVTYIGTAYANVTSQNMANVAVLPALPSNATYTLLISPASASLLVGATQQFVAQLSDEAGTYLLDVPNSDLSWISGNATVGTIDSLGVLTALSPGTTYVKVIYIGTFFTNVTSQNTANVTVNAAPSPANVSYILITPNPASLFVGQSQQFIATAYNASGASLGVLPNANLTWSVDNSTIGTIDANGTFTALAIGNAAVSATYGPLSANASATVSQFVPPPNGGGSGSGGSNNGGGSYKTATTVSFSCVGEAGTVKITVFDSKVKNATVDIFYLGEPREKVFTQEIAGTTTIPFTPEKQGEYELHVSVGPDQTSARFFVPYCGPETQNVTQDITVRLEPRRELIFTKLVKYPGGFSKLFSVYKITDGASENFESVIVLYFNYTGDASIYGFDILDSVPTSVIARTSQISFASKPTVAYSEPRFEWHVSSIGKNGKLSYSYSFERPLTEQMIDLFDAPSIRLAGEPVQATQDAGMLAASIGPIFGLDIPIIGVLIAFVVLLALLYFFLFRRKEEE